MPHTPPYKDTSTNPNKQNDFDLFLFWLLPVPTTFKKTGLVTQDIFLLLLIHIVEISYCSLSGSGAIYANYYKDKSFGGTLMIGLYDCIAVFTKL